MSIQDFENISHFICDYITKWANEKPQDIAIIDAELGKYYSWQFFENSVNMIAMKLIEEGWEKGDIAVSMLPFLPEHIFLEFACFKIGMIFTPLDLRLKRDEVIRSLSLLQSARRIMFIHPDDTDSEDRSGKKIHYEFKQIGRALRKSYPKMKDFIQVSTQEDCDPKTRSWLVFEKEAREKWARYKSNADIYQQKMKKIHEIAQKVIDTDPVFIIYTTGTTGFPKPAMLTNQGITAQNLCLIKGFSIQPTDRMLVNLPPSHVGGQTEQLMTSIMAGVPAILLHVFKADNTLKAIHQYKVTALGQIPSLFVMEWRLPNYKEYDLSSLRFALYGGQAVSLPFLQKLSKMAKFYGSGLGLTEMTGFCTYTPFGEKIPPEEIMKSLGYSFPISPLSIRKPMNPDGSAGDILPVGEIGEICFMGPQVFKGYYANPDATKKTISSDKVLYTGDLGNMDEKGYLHLTGRGKFVIKPKGYQVFPPQIEEYLLKRPEIANAAIVGHRHEEHSEGVVAFIELKKGRTITQESIEEHCKGLAAYMRPSLFIFIDEIPLNRVDKTDYQALLAIVGKYVDEERQKGGWDAKILAKIQAS
jgi:acyl-CoA synthetase (AMP-forming)/AMP-acid ligase II